MAQTDNPFLDGMAKAFTDAAGMAQGLRAEIDTFVRQRLERLVLELAPLSLSVGGVAKLWNHTADRG